MVISINSPTKKTFNAQIHELQKVVECFRDLRREEEHHVTVSSSVSGYPLLAAGILALIEERRREGFLITIEGDAIFHARVAVVNMEYNGELDHLSLADDNVFKDRGDLRNAFMYMLGELIDNICDHARVSYGIIGNVVDRNLWSVAVADCGISIPGAYRAAGFKLHDECDALKRAVQGVSTKTVEERGTGLPSVRRLMLEAFNGNLTIFSGGAFLSSDQGLPQCMPAPFFWQGAIVYLEGNIPSQLINLYDHLTR